ncbi:MAG: hypothetical protein AB9866_00985 [Syntrophobacteraceae bacterium]
MKQKFEKLTGILFKVGIPYTIVGIGIVFAGIYGLKHFFAQNEYLNVMQFFWLVVFWLVYQPLLKRRIDKARGFVRKS